MTTENILKILEDTCTKIDKQYSGYWLLKWNILLIKIWNLIKDIVNYMIYLNFKININELYTWCIRLNGNEQFNLQLQSLLELKKIDKFRWCSKRYSIYFVQFRMGWWTFGTRTCQTCLARFRFVFIF